MKKLLVIFTCVVLLIALCVAPIGGVLADEPEDEGTVVVDIDFSDPEIASEFGVGWAGGWEIRNEQFHTTQAWESSYYKQPIENFGKKKTVVTVDFFIACGTDMPAFSFGVVDDPSCIADDYYGTSGVTLRFRDGLEQLYASFTGNGEGEWMCDSQGGFVVSENPVAHTLEMTFDADKTVTVKVDGEVLSHSNGKTMSKLDYASKHDFSTGYLAMKATNVDSYVDNIKVVQYDVSAGDVSEEPINSFVNNSEVNGSNATIKGDGSGCNSAIGGAAGVLLVAAAGGALVVAKLKNRKK